MDLTTIPTKELSDELYSRSGIQSIQLKIDEKSKITVEDHERFNFDGPAVILINMD